MIAAAVIIFAIVLAIFAMAISVLMRLEAGMSFRSTFFMLVAYTAALAALGLAIPSILAAWIAVGFGIASIVVIAISIIKREKV